MLESALVLPEYLLICIGKLRVIDHVRKNEDVFNSRSVSAELLH